MSVLVEVRVPAPFQIPEDIVGTVLGIHVIPTARGETVDTREHKLDVEAVFTHNETESGETTNCIA